MAKTQTPPVPSAWCDYAAACDKRVAHKSGNCPTCRRGWLEATGESCDTGKDLDALVERTMIAFIAEL